MSVSEAANLADLLLDLVPSDGSPIGNGRLRQALSERVGREIDQATYFDVQRELVDRGLLVTGKGRGGSLRLAQADGSGLTLEAQAIPADAKAPKPQQKALAMHARRKPGEPTRPKRSNDDAKVLAYRHADKRKNNPEVGMVTPDNDDEERRTRWRYDPHIDPALQFDVERAQLENLIDDALASGDEDTMREALATLKRMAEPYLNWAGKAERTSFDIDLVSLHVHERIDPATILASVKKRMRKGEGQGASQSDMFRAWFEEPLPYREAIEFYKHDRGWANRLIAGDSLLVMNSLLEKEGMAGQAQMIYIDPPYGIKYGSNFQPFTNKKPNQSIDKDQDLTAEPEMLRAFRDTWELETHSYLTYLRDRLLLSSELLSTSGSIFVQISDENLHLVRNLMDEVFGPSNFMAIIAFRTKIPLGTTYLASIYDYLVWFAKDKAKIKFRKLYADRLTGKDTQFTRVQLPSLREARFRDYDYDPDQVPDGSKIYRATDLVSSGLTESCAFEFVLEGKPYRPKDGKSWKTNPNGMSRAIKAGRILHGRTMPAYQFCFEDFPVQEYTSVWTDTQGASNKRYVVETSERVIERCLLMTTDPGDLVFDPTCGGGTSAYVAEKWGRRWITCDSSRISVTLAKQRLMTADFDYYQLRYPHEGLKAGFNYKTVPHRTLQSVANNPEIDEIWDRMRPAISRALDDLNTALREIAGLKFLVTEGVRKDFWINFSVANEETMGLPSGEFAPVGSLLEWEVPFDFPNDWPESARASFDAFHKARQAMQRRMDQSIEAHADQETLYDRPEPDKNKLRISGPFTVEAVPFPSVMALEDANQIHEADESIARSGESARQHAWRNELLKTGIRGKNGQIVKFAELEILPDTRHLHCTGTLADQGERVVVRFGPEHAALEQRQVELAMREAGELFPRPKMIVFCAFAFDAEAAKDIDATKGIVALKAQMNTDLLTEDLKKARASNQSFWLMGQPDVAVKMLKDGKYQVEVHGFDYFDTAKGELVSGGKKKIAAWMLDTDYDERSLLPNQVFFPMAGAKDGWNKLKRNIRAELDETKLDRLHSTVSLPFEAGENRKIAVKIVDDRGIESLKVIPLDE